MKKFAINYELLTGSYWTNTAGHAVYKLAFIKWTKNYPI